MTAELLRCCWEIWLPAAFINYVTFCSNHVYFLPTIHLFCLSVCANLARTSVLSKLQMRQVQSIKKTEKHSRTPSTNKSALLSLKLWHDVSDQEVCQRGGAARDTVFPVREQLQTCWQLHECLHAYERACTSSVLQPITTVAAEHQQLFVGSRSTVHTGQTRTQAGNRRSPATRSEGNPTSVCVCMGGRCLWDGVWGGMHEQPLQDAKSQALCGLKIVFIKPEC